MQRVYFPTTSPYIGTFQYEHARPLVTPHWPPDSPLNALFRPAAPLPSANATTQTEDLAKHKATQTPRVALATQESQTEGFMVIENYCT
mgnify:CR=1 FL=1